MEYGGAGFAKENNLNVMLPDVVISPSEQFMLGGVSEPVALEIPVGELQDAKGLVDFLRAAGLDVVSDTGATQAGSDALNKIAVSTKADSLRVGTIVTPALKPEDVIPVYKTIKLLLTEYQRSFSDGQRLNLRQPHVLDLKNLVPEHAEKLHDAKDIEALLKEAEQSEDLVYSIPETPLANHFRLKRLNMLEQSAPNMLWGGSTMPDPYTVATHSNARYFRYAAPSVLSASAYASIHATKAINSFNNILPNGTAVGFLHQYKPKSENDFMMFGPAGIEAGKAGVRGISGDAHDETMVNRFNSECVATYVMWRGKDGSENMCKIPENNPKWQKLKDYFKPSCVENNALKAQKINGWYAQQGEIQTALPFVEKGKSAQDVYNSIQHFVEKQREVRRATEQEVQQGQEKLKQIQHDVSEYFFKLDGSYAVIMPGTVCARFDELRNDVNARAAEKTQYVQKLLEAKKQARLAIDMLKKHGVDVNEQVIEQVDAYVKKLQGFIDRRDQELANIDNAEAERVSLLVSQPQRLEEEQELSLKHRKLILAEVANQANAITNRLVAKAKADLVRKMHEGATEADKAELNAELMNIKANASKEFLEQLGAVCKVYKNEEFAQMFDNSLLAGLKRRWMAGTKRLAFAMATKTLDNQMGANAARNSVVHDVQQDV